MIKPKARLLAKKYKNHKKVINNRIESGNLDFLTRFEENEFEKDFDREEIIVTFLNEFEKYYK